MDDPDMQRTLCVEFSPLALEFDGATGWGPFAGFGGWRLLGPPGPNATFVQQQDIDLTGYAHQKKTFYPYSSFEQRGGLTSGTFIAALTAQALALDLTIISSVPLNDNDLAAAITYSPGFNYPSGFTNGEGRFDRSVIIHGESKTYTVDTSMAVVGRNNVLKLVDRQLFSSLEPTAADKLYAYRILTVIAAANEGTTCGWPATRVLLPGNIGTEPQLEYMMRLKRSYELANQV